MPVNLGLSLGVNKGQPTVEVLSLWLLPDCNHLVSRGGFVTALGDLGQAEKSLRHPFTQLQQKPDES